jgi:filamentous hemagglutinin family protein
MLLNRIGGLYQLKFVNALFVAVFWASANSVVAQIVPDATLPNNSRTTPTGNTFTIDGGTAAGENLFHSFREFSLPTGSTAFFNNAATINHIITRVTGGQVSNIDGLIRANGKANLFFINPSGIIFGPNARLEIGGSFIGSTADSIRFADGSVFSAKNPNAPPLLTVNVPVGLQLGQNPAEIRVEGTGHLLTQADFFTPIDRSLTTSGLRVASGNTLALVGGDITLSGGIVAADGGRVELGSVQNATVSLSAPPSSIGVWTFGYDDVQNFGNIRLLSQALVDASGVRGGDVRVQGRNIELRDGSVLLIQSQAGVAGSIRAIAEESVQMVGINADNTVRSGLYTENTGTGGGGDVVVSTPRFLLQQGGIILVTSYGTARGSNITVNAPELVELNGAPPSNPIFVSAIAISNITPATAGDIKISTGQLRLIDGAGIAATAFDSGFGGNVTISATESVEVIGIQPSVGQRSVMAASSFSTGDAGTLQIDTRRLVLRGAGNVATTTGANGKAGRLIINATESVEVSGFDPITDTPSRIDSSGIIFSPEIQRVFRLPPVPSGDAGGVEINTNVLRVTDGGSVSVENQGSGNAGILSVRANQILIEGSGGITASTTSGEGGNIVLQAGSLQLGDRSQITAEAGGTGNGGNITLNIDTLAVLEGSRINANAFEGAGGNISINAQGVYVAPNSTITASSRLGVAGVVQITNPEVSPNAGLIDLPAQVTDNSDQVVVGCAAAIGNSFTITGRGGLPEDPTATIRGQTVWRDWQDFSAVEEGKGKREVSSFDSSTNPPVQIVEATDWIINASGQVELVANSSNGAIAYPTFGNLVCKDLLFHQD